MDARRFWKKLMTGRGLAVVVGWVVVVLVVPVDPVVVPFRKNERYLELRGRINTFE